jgi:hypothetical protein
VKLSPGSECKIVFFGLFCGVNLILFNDVSVSMLIASSGPFRMYVDKQKCRGPSCPHIF